MTKTRNQQDVIQRLPCLVAHLIAESLGYFTPQSAAHAIAAYTKGEPCFCEWYYDWASKRMRRTNSTDLAATIREVGELAIRNAVDRRSHHRGPMAEFKRALPSSFMFGTVARGQSLHPGFEEKI